MSLIHNDNNNNKRLILPKELSVLPLNLTLRLPKNQWEARELLLSNICVTIMLHNDMTVVIVTQMAFIGP